MHSFNRNTERHWCKQNFSVLTDLHMPSLMSAGSLFLSLVLNYQLSFAAKLQLEYKFCFQSLITFFLCVFFFFRYGIWVTMRASEELQEQSLSFWKTVHSDPCFCFILKESHIHKGRGDNSFVDNSRHTHKIYIMKSEHIKNVSRKVAEML